ncbi:TPA: ArsR/SmtB family transcription factor, partial [Vibrio cholerae]
QLQQGSTLSQSAFSQHLTVLRKHGIIQARKESQQVFYRLADSRITALIQSLQNVFCR